MKWQQKASSATSQSTSDDGKTQGGRGTSTLIMLGLPNFDTVGEPLTLKHLMLQSERFALVQQRVLPTRLRHAQC